jgi:hypothetical protein
LQRHRHRSERWLVVIGIVKVINVKCELIINTNESTYIPAIHKHRLKNPGLLNLVMMKSKVALMLGKMILRDLRVPMGVVDTNTCFKAYDVLGKLSNVESSGDAALVAKSVSDIEQIIAGSF